MDNQHLHQQLDQLHQELESRQQVDEETRGRLQQLSQDIRRLSRDDESEPELSLSEQARSLEARFEADHPSAARLLHELVNTLARMGL